MEDANTMGVPDAEREEIIRERLRLHPRPRCQCDACVLSRRLDEARSQSEALREVKPAKPMRTLGYCEECGGSCQGHASSEVGP
jgi:hypothetical protein